MNNDAFLWNVKGCKENLTKKTKKSQNFWDFFVFFDFFYYYDNNNIKYINNKNIQYHQKSLSDAIIYKYNKS